MRDCHYSPQSIVSLLILVWLSSCTIASTTTTSQSSGPLIVALTPEVTLAPTVELTPEISPQPIEGAIGPYTYPDNVNPLTGLRVENPETLDRRPIIAKISNSPALVRPQSGIGEADIVYEHYTELGITRFSAIFYSHAPERIGSIRSARLIDYELVPMYQGLLAFAGASIGIDKRIYGSQTVIEGLCRNREDKAQCHVEANTIGPSGDIPPSEFADRAYKGVLFGRPYYWRDETIPVPHNLFFDASALWKLAASRAQAERPNLLGMAFHPDPPPNPSGPGNLAQVRYLTTIVQWHYDTETGLYYRSTDGQAHFDANTEQQINATNVVIVYAGHYLTDIVESGSVADDNVQWSTQITIWPEGDAVILRDGQRYEGRWLRPSRADLMSFRTNHGETLYLKPGNTWIQVVRLPEQMDAEREWVKIE